MTLRCSAVSLAEASPHWGRIATSAGVSSEPKIALVGIGGQRVEGAIGQRNAQRFGLGAVRVGSVAEDPAVNEFGLQAVVAEDAGAVGVRDRHHYHIPALDRADLRTDLDDTDGFVAHRPARQPRVLARPRHP